MNAVVNYADEKFYLMQRINSASATRVGGFDNVFSFRAKDMDDDFTRRNAHILSQPRGGGYWLWKPYFIRRALELLQEGDVLFYCDSGAVFVRSATPLLSLRENRGQSMLVFEIQHVEKLWAKRDALILMGCDEERFIETRQRLGGFLLMRKDSFSVSFVDEWLSYAQDERILTDLPNTQGKDNHPGFIAHRHDQSILSLLSKKRGLRGDCDPSQEGNPFRHLYPDSTYPQTLFLFRNRYNRPQLLSLLDDINRTSPDVSTVSDDASRTDSHIHNLIV